MSHCNLSDSSTKRMILQMEPYQYYTKVCTFFSLNSCFLSYFQGLRGIWSQPDLIPGFPVPHFLSPWTNGPQKFSPSGQMVPKQFGPPGQMLPNKFGPPGQMVPNQFGPHGQMVPIKFGPPGQMVPKNLVSLDKWSPTNLVPIFPNHHSLSPWTNTIF